MTTDDPPLPKARLSTFVLCAVFFASGAAALLFETLWFRQAGLLLGNTVWASTLVTASFMGGLALGTAVAMRRGGRLRRPLRAYAALECVVAASGLALVALLPRAIPVLAPWLGRAGEHALDGLRLGLAFVLLIAPSSAMGATLPVLARALAARDPSFGRVLGRLYGWNTLGAVAGAIAGEAFFVGRLGVPGTAWAAAALNLAAAAGALTLDRLGDEPSLSASTPSAGWASSSAVTRLGAAAFLAGGLLLALEIVWFRFLQLFLFATSIAFAAMLAVVLLGIGLGGLLGAAWLARARAGHEVAGAVALAAGALTVASYTLLDPFLARQGNSIILSWGGTLATSAALMLPVCLASGLLFTLLGKAVHDRLGEEAAAAGLLTLANTVGAMLGALVAGFVMLPLVGMERSLFVLAGGYGLVAALSPRPTSGGGRALLTAGAAVFALALALFPWGSMQDRHYARVAQRWAADGSRLHAWREGLTETVFLFRRDVLDRPLYWRLVTNGMGLSATNQVAQRYMGLFAWWPVALHPSPRSALLISYGLGTTARALTDTRELERIDVVDISADVLRTSHLVWPDPARDPLRDPRVQVHVEDGRFFLLTTPRLYDIITGEPPPPKAAGITSLYSAEYFRLMHDRLAEGGIATYWLPVLHMLPKESLSVVRAFCAAFDDCSLWTGSGHEWMLVGTRNAIPVSAARLAAQWQDRVVLSHLEDAGLDFPGDLGATFLADAEALRVMAEGVEPLSDAFPYRLDPAIQGSNPSDWYLRVMDVAQAREAFAKSAFVARLWPADWVAPTLLAFERLRAVNRIALAGERVSPVPTLKDVDFALEHAGASVSLWHFGSGAAEVRIAKDGLARGLVAPEMQEILGIGAIARREYREGERRLALAEPHAGPRAPTLRQWRILALARAGERSAAQSLLDDSAALRRAAAPGAAADEWAWLAERAQR